MAQSIDGGSEQSTHSTAVPAIQLLGIALAQGVAVCNVEVIQEMLEPRRNGTPMAQQ